MNNVLICAGCVGCGSAVDYEMSSEVANDEQLKNAELAVLLCEECRQAKESEETMRDFHEKEARKLAMNRELEEKRRAESRILENKLPWDSENEKANLELYDWVSRNRNESLWISGKTGLGKTRIVQKIGLEMCKSRSVLFSRAPDLLDEICGVFSKNCRKGESFLRELYNVDLLIVDDLGKESLSPAKASRLYQLLDERYIRYSRRIYAKVRGWQLWVTTNDNGSGLLEAVGNVNGYPQIRRIKDMCQVAPLSKTNASVG